MRELQIDTDGRTVWVNRPDCIARFCPVSGEVYSCYEDGYVLTAPIWGDWKEAVFEKYQIEVADKFQPKWSK
jgi:hypothetical protein